MQDQGYYAGASKGADVADVPYLNLKIWKE